MRVIVGRQPDARTAVMVPVMSRVPEEPPSWSAKAEEDALFTELRQQLEAVRARLSAHREEMEAAGLTSTRDPGPDSAG